MGDIPGRFEHAEGQRREQEPRKSHGHGEPQDRCGAARCGNRRAWGGGQGEGGRWQADRLPPRLFGGDLSQAIFQVEQQKIFLPRGGIGQQKLLKLGMFLGGQQPVDRTVRQIGQSLGVAVRRCGVAHTSSPSRASRIWTQSASLRRMVPNWL